MQKLNDDLDKYTSLLEEGQQRISDLETQLDMESEKVSNLLRMDESQMYRWPHSSEFLCLLHFLYCSKEDNLIKTLWQHVNQIKWQRQEQ